MKTPLPKFFLLTGCLILLAASIGLDINIAVLFIVCGIAFVVDILYIQYEKHRKVLSWIANNVQLTDKPIEKSDAPESLLKLVRKEEDRESPKH